MISERNDEAILMLLRQGLDRIDQGITIFDKNLRLIAWNTRFLTLLKFPKELAYEGAEFASFMRHNAEHGEYGLGDRDTLVAERVAAARKFERHEFERERPDGTVVKVTGTPLSDGGFVTVYTDVTAQRRREAQLRDKVAEETRNLQFSEARLQLIANEVPAGIAHIDKDMKVLFANERFARAYKLTPEEILGMDCNDVLHPKTMADSARYFEQARRGALVDFEIEITLPGSSDRTVRTFLRPEQPSRGDVIGFYILSVDVSGKKVATSALMRAQKMDAIGRISTGVSHDFNNLLTVILGNLSPLAELIEDDALREKYLNPTIAAARRGSSLTKRLLNLARRRPINPAAVDVQKAIGDLAQLLKISLPEGVKLTTKFHEEKQFVFVDLSELETALLNLIVNARDAMMDSGEIEIQTDDYYLTPTEADLYKIASDTYLRIRVSDSGIGMSPTETERIFEPFYTSKADNGGSGMGLAMVYAFVQQSNGVIYVESEIGQGTEFSILLPKSEETIVPVPQLDDIQSKQTSADKRKLVLLVEDDKDVRLVVRRQLTDLGYNAVEAENAETARHLLSVLECVDLVLSDVAMPGSIDGYDLAIGLLKTHPQVPIVLMSGHLNASDNMTDLPDTIPLLTKPFDKIELSMAFSTATNGLQDFTG